MAISAASNAMDMPLPVTGGIIVSASPMQHSPPRGGAVRPERDSSDGTEGAFVEGRSGEALPQRRARLAAQQVCPGLRSHRCLRGRPAEQAADIDLAVLAGGRTRHSPIREPCISRSAASGTLRAWTLRPNQRRPSVARLQAPAIRAHDAFAEIILPPARVLAQLAARLPEMVGQQRVHREARQAQRGRGQGPRR